MTTTIAGLRSDVDDLMSDYEDDTTADDTTADDPGLCPCDGPTSVNETENSTVWKTYFPVPGRCPCNDTTFGNETTLSTILKGLDQWFGK